MIFTPMVQLAPRGWMPNPQLTGGNLPSQSLYISHDHWMAVGSPQSIEDYYDKIRELDAAPKLNTYNFRGFINPQQDA